MAQDRNPQYSDWYAQPAQEERSVPYTEPEPAPGTGSGYSQPAGPVPGRTSRRTKAVWITVCALILCLAAAAAVWQAVRLTRMVARVPSADRSGWTDGSGVQVPGDYYEDFRDYFDEYYQLSNEIFMPRAETGAGVRLSLLPRAEEELTLQEIYDRVSPAVVGISTYLDGQSFGWGTGVVFSPDGYIVTNTHLLQSCTGARVILADGREFDALLVGADEASDIAVLYVQAEDLPWAPFGESDDLQVGDTAVAIGNPLSQEYTGTMTNGIISAIDRNVVYEGHTMTLLQTNAALNEGNSGGPLINAAGQVVGITNMKVMTSYDATVEGIGFAIPSSVVKQIADQLLEQGVVSGEPTIGIVAGPVNDEAMELYGLPKGIYVTEVSPGSDALEKGLQKGDVITAVNGRPITTVAQVNHIKEDMKVGDSLTLSVYREGKSFDMEILLVDKADIQ